MIVNVLLDRQCPQIPTMAPQKHDEIPLSPMGNKAKGIPWKLDNKKMAIESTQTGLTRL